MIHPKSARYIYAHLGSDEKELVWWHNSGHGVVFDSEREAVWERIWAFVLRSLNSFTASRPGNLPSLSYHGCLIPACITPTLRIFTEF